MIASKIKAYSPRNLYLRRKIKKDEKFLLEEGLKIAKAKGLEINVACGYFLEPPEKKGELYLPPENSKGKINVTPLIELGAEEHPEIAKRYLENKRRLSRVSSET